MRTPPVLLTLFISIGTILAFSPPAAAEPCIDIDRAPRNTTQIIFDVLDDRLRVGIRAEDPGAGVTAILYIRPNSCTSGGIGPGLIGTSQSAAPELIPLPVLP